MSDEPKLPSWEETLERLSQAVEKDSAKRKLCMQQPTDEQRKKLLKIFLNVLIDGGSKK